MFTSSIPTLLEGSSVFKMLNIEGKKLKSLSKYFSYYLKTLLYSHSLNTVSNNANRIGLIK